MLGWFSSFREYGAPTFYGENRTPVILDTHIFGLFAIFVVPSIAFLIILPGVRKKRFASACSFFFSMYVGATLLVSLYHPCWHRAETPISSAYRSFSNAKIDAHILVRVGLQYLNISLSTISPHESTAVIDTEQLLYNERFSFSEVNKMESELSNALRKGLPFPILKVIEYLSGDGFAWGRQYRVAGYYTASMLWLSFSIWLLSLVCLAFLPHYFARCIFYAGLFMGIGDIIFVTNIPRQMYIQFPAQHGDTLLKFRLSICFHATCIAAILCLVIGALLWIMESKNIYHFDTIFSARRHAQDSVVDVYKDDASMTTTLSSDSRISGKWRPRCSSIASDIFFKPGRYTEDLRL
nr:Dual oxidase maturation factor domain containing protein [Haemonchus contortus]